MAKKKKVSRPKSTTGLRPNIGFPDRVKKPAVQKSKRADILELRMDIHNPEKAVEITISSDRTKMWINVDGICCGRIQGIDPSAFYLNGRNLSPEELD